MKTRMTVKLAGQDRRIQRTREALREAMMALMVECGWDAIDVQTLCERANVGRSTFYQHYPNKEDLLIASLGELRLVLQAQAGQAAPGCLSFVPGLIEHVYQAQEVFRALLGRRSGQFVQDRFRELLVQMVQAEIGADKEGGWQAAAQAHYLGGALFELLAWWLGRGQPQKPQEIEAVFKRWSSPALMALMPVRLDQ